MTTIFIIALFIIGIFLIVLEAIVPFGLAAIAGVGIIAFSVYLAFTNFSLTIAILYCVVALVVALLVVRYSIRYGLDFMSLAPPAMKKNRPITTQTPMDREPAMGDVVKVIQPLRPTGSIEWEHRRLAARTLRPEKITPVGAHVRIAGKDSTFWLVEEVAADAAPGAKSSAPDSSSAVSARGAESSS